VIVVVLLIATAVMPNILSMQRSREERSFWGRFERIPQRAREEAIARAQTVTLRAFDGEEALELVAGSATDPDAETQSIYRLDMVGGGTVQAMQVNSQPASSGDFQLRFFPDGSSDTGGITVQMGDLVRSLTVDRRGRGRVADGAIEEQDDDTAWPAGDFEQRGQ